MNNVSRPSIPTIFLDHVGQFDNELALLILLTRFESMLLKKKITKNQVLIYK